MMRKLAYTLGATALALVALASTSSAAQSSITPRNGGYVVSIDSQPSASAVSGEQFARQPGFTVESGGNPATGVTITRAIASAPSGTSTLSGAASVTTDADGIAMFSDLAITGPAGDYTVSFTAGSTTVTSQTITISAVPVIGVLQQPSATADSGTTFARQPVFSVTERDANLEPMGGVTITASIASAPSGTSSLSGATSVTTAADGSAQFADLGITGPSGDYTLSFSATGATTIISQTITVSGDDPSPDTNPEVAQGTAWSVASGEVTLSLPASIRCTVSRDTGAWIRLPSAGECFQADGTPLTSTQLLGWATSPDFPREIALRQIANDWGAYEILNDDDQITDVYIRAGGWTAQTAPGTLFAIVANDVR